MIVVTISSNQIGIDNHISRYCLENAYINSCNVNIGIVICYLISIHKNVKFLSLYGDNHEDDKKPINIVSIGKYEFENNLCDFPKFFDFFKENIINSWHLTCLIEGVKVDFYGNVYGNGISVSMPKESRISVISILENVEQNTHRFK